MKQGSRFRVISIGTLVVLGVLIALWQYFSMPGGRNTPRREPGEVVGLEDAAELFNRNCEGCHGPTRAGATGPALLPETLGDKTDEFLATTIRVGRPGTAMPSWKGTLTENEIMGLVKFLKTPPGKTPTWTLKDIESSRRIFIKKEDLPKEPTHKYDIKKMFFVVQREVSKGAFVDGDTFKVVKEHPLGFAVHKAEYSRDGRFAYLIARNGLVTKIDLYSLEKVGEVRAGLNARGVAVSRDGKYVAVSNYLPFNMVILDADDLKPIKIIPFETIDPDGKKVKSRGAAIVDSARYGYFLVALKEGGQVWIIDYKDPDLPVVAKIMAGRILHDFFWDKSGRYWMGAAQLDNSIVVIDAQERRLAARIPTGIKPHPGPGAVWESKGREVAGTVHIGEGKLSVWEVGTWKVVGSVKTAGPGLFLRAHPKSKYVWTDTFTGDGKDAVQVHDKDTFEVVKTIIPSKGKTSIHPEFSYDGKHVLVSVWDRDGEIVVYDAETLKEVTRIRNLVTPTGIFNVGTRLDVGEESNQ